MTENDATAKISLNDGRSIEVSVQKDFYDVTINDGENDLIIQVYTDYMEGTEDLVTMYRKFEKGQIVIQ